METNMMVKVGGDSIFCVFENVTKIGKNSKASGKMQQIEKVKNCFKNVTKTNSLPQSKQKKKKKDIPPLASGNQNIYDYKRYSHHHGSICVVIMVGN